MKEYVSPVVEFIEFEENDVICESYVCPNMYGNACPGNPLGKLQDGVSKSSKKQEPKVKVGFDLTFDK